MTFPKEGALTIRLCVIALKLCCLFLLFSCRTAITQRRLYETRVVSLPGIACNFRSLTRSATAIPSETSTSTIDDVAPYWSPDLERCKEETILPAFRHHISFLSSFISPPVGNSVRFCSSFTYPPSDNLSGFRSPTPSKPSYSIDSLPYGFPVFNLETSTLRQVFICSSFPKMDETHNSLRRVTHLQACEASLLAPAEPPATFGISNNSDKFQVSGRTLLHKDNSNPPLAVDRELPYYNSSQRDMHATGPAGKKRNQTPTPGRGSDEKTANSGTVLFIE